MFAVVFLITKTNKEQCQCDTINRTVRSYILPPIVAIMNHKICTKINLTLKRISKYTRNRNNTNVIDFRYYWSSHMIYNYSRDIQRHKPFYGKIDIQV